MNVKKVLIVEDEPLTAELIRGMLEGRGYQVTAMESSASGARRALDAAAPDIILMDIRIKGKTDGIELAGSIRRKLDIPVIFLTAFADRETVERAKQVDSYGYIIKPFGELELITTIEIALHKHIANSRLRASEERYRSLFESLKDAVYIRALEGRLIEFNPAFAELFGYSEEELDGFNMGDFYDDPAERGRFERRLKRVRAVKDFEVRFRRKDGALINCLITANLIASPDGKSKTIRGIIHDITERDTMRHALQTERDFINAVINSLPALFFVIDREGRLVRWNRTLESLASFSGKSLEGINVLDLMRGENRDLFRDKIEEGFSGGDLTWEARLSLPGRRGASVDYLFTVHREAIDGIEYAIGTAVDITDRKGMEQALRESEKRFHSLFDNLTDAVAIHGIGGRYLEVNRAACEQLGYSRDEFLMKNAADIFSPEYSRLIPEWSRRIIGDGSALSDAIIITKGGEPLSVEINSRLVHYMDATAILSIARDVTERKKATLKLKKAHDDIRLLLNSISAILIGVSTEDVITHWNGAAEKIFGIPADEALGEKITGFKMKWEWDSIYIGIYQCTSEDRPIALTDIAYTDNSGREGVLGVTINPIRNDGGEIRGFLIQGKDITDRRIMERQLLQAGKMATVGEMATGVAHELNQPLNVIKMGAQYLLDSIAEKYFTDEFAVERLEKIVKQVDRAANIINHLRDFGRVSDYDIRPMDPNKPVRASLEMLGEQMRLHGIAMEIDLDPGLPHVAGDHAKLEQVFINLIVNAKDAMEGMAAPPEQMRISIRSFREGGEGPVCIEFRDNGPGVPPGIVDRLFEPFFTTKEVGKGTGLGLSISYGIIKAHRGSIEVVSEKEGGRFLITLPVGTKIVDGIGSAE